MQQDLWKLRRQRGWTINQLAAESQVPGLSIYEYEQGRPIRAADLPRLAAALGVAPDTVRLQSPAKPRKTPQQGTAKRRSPAQERPVEGADIICTVTSAKEPVVKGEWIAPGTHINAVGAFTPTTRELDIEAVVHSRLYVDRRESTLNEAGQFLIPKSEGLIRDDHIVGELGEILTGKVLGRGSPDEITLFKALGIAVEDLASAYHVLTKARERGVGA